MVSQKEQDPSQPAWVIKGHRKRFSLAQVGQSTPQVSGRSERRAQGKPEVDGLLTGLALLRQMREHTERLLEVPHRLAVG